MPYDFSKGKPIAKKQEPKQDIKKSQRERKNILDTPKNNQTDLEKLVSEMQQQNILLKEVARELEIMKNQCRQNNLKEETE